MNTFNVCKVPAPMELQNDFEDLCASLNGRSVEYLIVGGYALAFHGAPRFTGDIDIFVRPAPDNIDRLLTALGDFGFRESPVRPEDLLCQGKILELGRPPLTGLPSRFDVREVLRTPGRETH